MATTRTVRPVIKQSSALAGKDGVPSVEGFRWMQSVNDSLVDAQSVANNSAAQSQSAFMTFLIEFADDKDYPVLINAPVGFTITSITTKSSAGTCTLTGKINATALGGTANSVSTSEQTQTHASANTVAAGDDVTLTVSSNSGAESVSVTIACTLSLGAA